MWARGLGYLVRQGVDPVKVPLQFHGRGLALLTVDGSVVDAADVVDPGDVAGVA